ncbi:MAG: T9SS type A sorting domain-containing protein [Ignavibacteriae bacterium]|nr:T9SS type A sorting domain-containing protein [Ignavibacteriota bacterium]
MKKLVALLATVFVSTILSAQTWKFVGPDSVSWRNAVQMDVQFRQGAQPRVAVATTKGLAANLSGTWKYVFPDDYWRPVGEDRLYRSIYFSPWNDSVAFVGVDMIEPGIGEPGSAGLVVLNVYQDRWYTPVRCLGDGGWIGHAPSLAYVFSPHGQNKVFAWLVNLFRSTNNGLEWQRTNLNTYGCFFHSADLKKDSVLYAGFRSNAIYRSTDDGATWTNIHPFTFSMSYPHPYADFFANGDTLIWSLSRFPHAADTLCGIQVSVDRGATWTYVLRNINVQKFVRDEGRRNVFYAAAEGGIYRSTNSGMSWNLRFSNVPSPKLVDIRKDPFSDTLYVATRDSGVYKVADRTLDAIVREPLPTRFMLQQNYPNPFNPTTNIKFTVPVGAGHAPSLLRVFDILGREVATLVNEVKEPGEYNVTWDARDVASGVYLCRLSSSGFVATKRMILLK